MKLRSKRGVNCDEARERTTSVMENTTPAIVVIEAAMILSTALAPSGPPANTSPRQSNPRSSRDDLPESPPPRAPRPQGP